MPLKGVHISFVFRRGWLARTGGKEWCFRRGVMNSHSKRPEPWRWPNGTFRNVEVQLLSKVIMSLENDL
jgi:hypothetical protein